MINPRLLLMSIIGFYPIISDYWFLFLVLSFGLSSCSPQLLILMIFKLENNAKKGKHMENQKAKLKNWKKRKQNKWGKKGTSKCPFAFSLHLFCFLVLLLFCFFFAFCLEKTKNKIKAKKTNLESNINAKKKQMDKSIFFPCFPFLTFLFYPFFCPFYFAFVFFGFCWFAFWFFIFLLLSRCFSSFKQVRISGGLADISLSNYWSTTNPLTIRIE